MLAPTLPTDDIAGRKQLSRKQMSAVRDLAVTTEFLCVAGLFWKSGTSHQRSFTAVKIQLAMQSQSLSLGLF
jgi:hypothetical protein